MLLELHDADDVASAIQDGDVYAYWAPGDATLYRVALLRYARYGLDALSRDDDLTLLLVTVADSTYVHVLVPKPRADFDRWTPEVFLAAFGERFAGWWAGVRPLLAALDWAHPDHASVAYDPRDAVTVGQLLATQEVTS